MLRGGLWMLMLLLHFGSNGQEQLKLEGHWYDSTLVASTAHNNVYNEVWGLYINDHEIAIIGSTYGTHFLDVTNPALPLELFRIPGKAQGRSIVHRDYHHLGDYLYAVCDEGPSSLQIMDISQLPDTVMVMYDSDTLIQRSHNIFIDSSSSLLYSLATRGTKIGGAAMSLFDISSPLNPQHIGNYQQFGDIRAGHVHDAFVQNDTAFLNCGYDGFAIVDFSDPANPNPISTLQPNEYPASGYNHSGWATSDGQRYYMADENHGLEIKNLNLSYPSIEVSDIFDANSSSDQSIPHNLIVACDYLYASYYYDGLQVYDISDPASPERVGYYPTSSLPHRNRYEGAWGVFPFLPSGNILVSDMQEGLFVVEGIDTECNSSIITSTQDSKNHNISIQPNPADDAIVIHGVSVEEPIMVHNMQGQVMFNGYPSNRGIDISRWPLGTYILSVNEHQIRLVKN